MAEAMEKSCSQLTPEIPSHLVSIHPETWPGHRVVHTYHIVTWLHNTHLYLSVRTLGLLGFLCHLNFHQPSHDSFRRILDCPCDPNSCPHERFALKHPERPNRGVEG